MRRRIAFAMMVFAIASCGFVIAANVSRLVDTNPGYEASWWKVAFAAFLVVVFGSIARSEG